MVSVYAGSEWEYLEHIDIFDSVIHFDMKWNYPVSRGKSREYIVRDDDDMSVIEWREYCRYDVPMSMESGIRLG